MRTVNWPSILLTITSPLGALVGVVVGAYLTARHQRAERRHSVIREQLETFYSPLLGKREQLRAKGELRLKVSGAANAAWQQMCIRVRTGDPFSEADALH